MTKKHLNKTIPIIYSIIIFILSVIILDLYQYGDQFHYIKYWEDVVDLSFIEAYKLSFNSLGSAEPVYTILTYFFSGIVEKDIIISTINAILAYSLIVWMLDNKVHNILIPFLLLNFYFLVLLFAAERLKLAFLFILLAENFSKRKVVNKLLLLLALLSHITIAIILIVQYINPLFHFLSSLLNGRILKKHIYIFPSLLLVIVSFFLFFNQYILAKLDAYSLEDLSLIGAFKVSVFIIMAAIYSKNRHEVIVASFPIIIAATILGPNRVVMFACFYFMYYGLRYKRGINIGTLIFTLYFLVIGITFINTIVDHGNGFYFATENKNKGL